MNLGFYRHFNQRWVNREPKLQPILSHLHAALASHGSSEAISEDLFDMIGYDDMDMIVEVLDNRSFIAAEVRDQLRFCRRSVLMMMC